MECNICGTVLIIPEGIKKICFTDICGYIHKNQIEEILLPSTLKVIEAYTFYDFTEVKRINVPSSVTKIGSEAFFGLDSLKELCIPLTVKRVEKHAFCNLPECRLVISGKCQEIPSGWDREFAANVKEICFA